MGDMVMLRVDEARVVKRINRLHGVVSMNEANGLVYVRAT